MTITSELIKKAFAPITSVQKTEPVGVDLEKVTTALSKEITKFADSEDPMAVLGDLETTVGKFEQMLEDSTSDADGNVVVTGKSVEFAKGFAPEVAATPEPKVTEKTEEVAVVEAEVKETTEKTEVEEAAKTDDEVDPKVDTEAVAKTDEDTDLSDDVDWEDDLSPSSPPTMRNERLTKGERPIPARKGGRKATKKAAEARKAAMAVRKKPVLDSDA